MKLSLKEMTIFALLGAVMYSSKIIMEFMPNVHLIGVFVMALTLCYGVKALYPIYVFIFLTGLTNGFALWWWPYLYLWIILWGVTMLLPKNMHKALAPFVYSAVCALHGFLYGTMYSPYQALMFHLDFKGMIAWIVAGLPWDMVHGVSNFICGFLIIPLYTTLKLSNKYIKE